MTRSTGYATAMYAGEDVAYPTLWEAGEHRPAAVRKSDETMHAAGGLGISARDAAAWLSLQLMEGYHEDEELLSRLYVDMSRLCGAFVVDGPDDGEDG